MVDVFVHGLLAFITTVSGLVTFMEFLTKNNVLLRFCGLVSSYYKDPGSGR